MIRLESSTMRHQGRNGLVFSSLPCLCFMFFCYCLLSSPQKGIFSAPDTGCLGFASHPSCVYGKMSCPLAVPCACLVLCVAAFCHILTLNTMTPIFLCPCGDLLACILEVKWLHVLSGYAITMLQNNYCCQLYYFSAYICDQGKLIFTIPRLLHL